ncbi:hypothetical protein BDN72DRAFT_830094 [Pluteus cervinus]|uniref:Uncharacterized protein n=1 Tax=Pluteus cervinus TaxID=181527 RepID=A0ACD3BFW3_9AGAR|nr:hypothetical protein BDN72DRAFT_830094 [Pluteus cervinus]
MEASMRVYDVSEATPLLGSHLSPSAQRPSTQSSSSPIGLPSIAPTAAQLLSLDLRQVPVGNLCPHPLDYRSLEWAFILTLLLHIRHQRLQQSVITPTDYPRLQRAASAAQEVAILDSKIQEAWSISLDELGSIHDIQAVIWSQFPLDERNSTVRLNVMFYLCQENAPIDLVLHPLVETSILRTWRTGEKGSPARPGLKRIYDGACTPRVCHFLDLISQLALAGILVHYIILPPVEADHIASGKSIRAALLLLISFSWILRPWSLSAIPSFLTFFSFLTTLPYTLTPANTAFQVLPCTLVLHILQLHYPSPPSHLFLFSPRTILPLTTLLWQGVSMAVLPVITFFLPALLIALALVSASLVGTLSTISDHLHDFISIPPSPVYVRYTFFALLVFLVILMISTLVLLLLSSALWFPRSASPWDKYSLPIGIRSRVRFYSTVRVYSHLYYFPPPLNLLYTLFIVPISFPFFLCGSVFPYSLTDTKWFWRLTAGPVIGVVALLARTFSPEP